MMKEIVITCVSLYQRLASPAFHAVLGPGAGCRYYPSCSSYAIFALRQYGLWRGSVLSVSRVLRCNPFFAGGYDPLPRRPLKS